MRLKYYTVDQKQSFGTLRKDEKMHAKGMPKVIQNESKKRSWATSGSIFEILGGFRKE
jgi:hypothetical protein